MRIHCLKYLVAFFVCAFGQASMAEVFDLSAIINAPQETHDVIGAPASAAGFATVQYDDVSKNLSWNVAWQDLSGPSTGMHFHSPAGLGENAGVTLNIGDVSGIASPSIGSATITDAFASDLLAGQSYINIHTAQNGPGEIRGQVSAQNINLTASLDVAQEIPTPSGVPADANGLASIALDPTTNVLGWNIEWSDLTGPATGMHFHGPAGVGETAGVLVNIGATSGLTSPSIGSVVISDDLKSQLLAGQLYLNIHTALNGPGEIRGQVVPEPATATLALFAAWGVMTLRRKRSK